MDRVEQELKVLSTTSFKRFWFTDCLFGSDEERYVWVLRQLAKWPNRPAFGFETRAELLTPRLIEALSQVQLDFLAIGIQTLDRKVLSNVHRGHAEHRVFAALDRLMPSVREKHRVHLDVILGLPGDTVTGVRNTIDTLHGRYPEASFYFELLKVLPGTPMWEIAADKGWVSHGPAQTHDLVQSDSFALEEIVQLKTLGLGLEFLQGPRVRPHVRSMRNGMALSELALAAGAYLIERDLSAHRELDGHSWLSRRLARHTRRVLHEIESAARRGQSTGSPTAAPAAELSSSEV